MINTPETPSMCVCYIAYLEYYPWKKSEYPDYESWLTSDADDARIFRQGWAASLSWEMSKETKL
jgi:hypothetical protein